MALHVATIEGSDKTHLVASGQVGTLCGKGYSDLPLSAVENADWCKSCSDAGTKIWDEERSVINDAAKARAEALETGDTEPGKPYAYSAQRSKGSKSEAKSDEKVPSTSK